VLISKIPAASLPQEGVPSAAEIWQTPAPIHFGDLGTSSTQPVSNQPIPTQPIPTQPVPNQPIPTQKSKFTSLIRVAGTDRVDTAIQQALLGWPQGSEYVILARSDDFPDALAGVPLAAQLNAPILLTSPQSLDSRVQAALQKLHPAKIYLLGGEGALSDQVSSALSALGWNTGKQIRLSGPNRYATAAIIAQNLIGQHQAVAIATGENFPDALSIASIAGQTQMPVLLTEATQVPQETLNALQRIKPSKVYLIGGEGVISNQVSQQIASALNLPSADVMRLAGATRYDTMAAVGNAFAGDVQSLCFATGEDFPNALTGAALAAHMHQTLVLLPNSPLSNYTGLEDFIANHLAQSSIQPYLFGSQKAIPQSLEDELNKLLMN
jgi:putative cell wall-binding protein